MRITLLSLLVIAAFSFLPAEAFAIEDPLRVPNNKIGIHILFPAELEDAAKLINHESGDWGYVTIPIQSGDRDLEKWQQFMDECKRLHVIPIVRLATEGDYFNTKVWRTPKNEDIIDFANFLNSLSWPTKNRYVIVFNEVNRGDEWGGKANPEEYARLLSYATTVFKAKNHDFFVISAGLDNAAPNEGTTYMNQYDYMRRMHSEVPGIFNQVDGLASHSYPNPAFSQPPTVTTNKSIVSFRYERDLAYALSGKKLPVFITETGWTAETVDDARRASYYTHALSDAWSDEGIVAITPFLLKAGGGPFGIFTFLTAEGKTTKQYDVFAKHASVSGRPVLASYPTPLPKKSKRVLGTQITVKDFRNADKNEKKVSLSLALQSAFEWIMKI